MVGAVGVQVLPLAWLGPEAIAAAPGTDTLPLHDALAMFDAALTVQPSALVLMRLSAAIPDHVPAVLRDLIDIPASGSELTASAISSEFAAEMAGLPEAEQIGLLLGVVQAQTAELCGLNNPGAVAPDEAFKTLGFTSLNAVALRDRLAAVTGKRLPATIAFDYPTPAAVARYIRAEP